MVRRSTVTVPAPSTGAAQSALPDHVLGRQRRLGRQPQPLGATLERDLHPGARLAQALQRGEIERRAHLLGRSSRRP